MAIAYFFPHLLVATQMLFMHFFPSVLTSVFSLAFVFLIHPLIDLILSKQISTTATSKFYSTIANASSLRTSRAAVRIYPLIQSIFLIYCFYWITNLNLDHSENFWIITLAALSVGTLTGGLGITCAHELIHRKSRLDRFLGLILLHQTNYMHFEVEHIKGHHKNVGTAQDPASADRGEILYFFWPRAVLGGLISSYKIQSRTQDSLIRNKIIHFLVIEILTLVLIQVLLGSIALAFFVVQSIVAILLVETVNYIEHYGLRRKRQLTGAYEPVHESHSWDCGNIFTNIFLFNIAIHADHHEHPQKHFPMLHLRIASKKYDIGYSALIWLALIYPLWRQYTHPILDRSR